MRNGPQIWIWPPKRVHFLGVRNGPSAACHFISTCSAAVQLRGYGPSRSPPACSPEIQLIHFLLNPTSGNFLRVSTKSGIAFYLCRHITVTDIKTNASPYPRWSAVGIKLVEPFKRMTVDIFQGEGGGRLRRNPAALRNFTAKLE